MTRESDAERMPSREPDVASAAARRVEHSRQPWPLPPCSPTTAAWSASTDCPLHGRAEIASALEGIFGSHQTARYVAKVRDIRRLGADVLLLRSVVGMMPPGKDELNPAVNAIQSLVAVERGADLRIALLHNTPAAFHGRPEMAENSRAN